MISRVISLILALALVAVFATGLLAPVAFCLAMIVWMLVLLVSEVHPPEVTMTGTLAFMVLGSFLHSGGFISLEQAMGGYSNPALLTVAALFVVARAVRLTGFFDAVARVALGSSKGEASAIGKMALPLMSLSAFFNNTPIVAIFMPILRDWGIRNGIVPSKLLIPLSYLTAFGGLCTLLGTSTHLVIRGMAQAEGISPYGMFDLAWVGVPMGLVGVMYLCFFGVRLLPKRGDHLQGVRAQSARFTMEIVITENSPLSGRTLVEAGLRDLGDLFVVEVIRGEQVFSAVKGSFVLNSKDRLVLVGSRDHAVDLLKINGIEASHHQEGLVLGRNSRLLEVVIGPGSPLRGKTLKELHFNRTYNASVIGLHRRGEDLQGGFGRLPLQAGDTLTLLADIGFRRAWQDGNDFLMVSPIREDLYHRHWTPLCLIMLVLMIALPSLGLMPVLLSATLCAVIFCWLRVIDPKQAMQSIDWGVLLTIGASFGISSALVQSGAATWLSGGLLHAASLWGPLAALVLLYIGTNLLTEIITNNAAAALAFPIALTCSKELSVDPIPFLIAIAVAASASFATPIGYQTNLIVYGPGGYRYADFLKVGLPLNILYAAGSAMLIPWLWPF
ncbi:MAG: SLC13 family permease [Planctomycetes bacterium]|nr:SLC13 family permease [Planctomycetota bacterium]